MSLSGHGLRPESEDATRKERGERMLSFIVRFRSALAEGSEAAARVLSSDGAVAFFSSAELAIPMIAKSAISRNIYLIFQSPQEDLAARSFRAAGATVSG